MATNGSTIVGCSGRNSGKKTRRTWSVSEETVLLQSLKEAIVGGWKSENGFKTGYLIFLETKLKDAFPGTDLRGNPHIDSKIHVWKRTYGQLRTILSRSGVGWNVSENLIDVSDETWEDIVKMDSSARGLRYKTWPQFNDWSEIFGQDRATGEYVETFADCMNASADAPMSDWGNAMDLGGSDAGKDAECAGESTTVSQQPHVTTEKAKKRKSGQEDELSIATAINNFAATTRATMCDFMKEFANRSRATVDLTPVLDALNDIPDLSITDRVELVEILAEHPTKADVFFKLTPEERICFVRRLLHTARFRF